MRWKKIGSLLGGLGLACVICCAGPLYVLATATAGSVAAALLVSEAKAMFILSGAMAIITFAALYWFRKGGSADAPCCVATDAKACRRC